MKKLLSLLLVGMFTGISFASASTIDISWDSENGYTPLAITIYQTGDITANDFSDFVCGDNAVNCELVITSSWQDDGRNCKLYIQNGVLRVNNTKCQNLTPNIYGLIPSIQTTKIPFSSLKFTSNLIDPPSEDNSDTPLLGGVGQDFASGITSGVGSLTSGISNVLPTLILLMLPLFLMWLLLKYIRSYLKHVFVWDKPRGDDMANCKLRFDENGNAIHQITNNGREYVYIEGLGRYIEKDDNFASYVNENLDFDYKAYAKDHYSEFWTLNYDDSPYYRGGEYDENRAYRDFMHFEYQAGIDYDEAVHNWNTDAKKGLSYRDRVDRAYYDYKYSREYDD